ncbi:MAG TPA: MFS transporter [Candidatus Limnocylindrales bacterium]|nr:MFS transporter [Candidatus Limnocylindrales bacterium]
MPFPAGLSAPKHRDFRVFWSGQLVSQLGTWMQRVGQAWLVLELTNSARKLGIITALQFSPVLVLSVLAGAVVDRVVKRRLLVLTHQITVPDALRGRVMSLYAFTFAGITPFGSIVVGMIAERFGTSTACAFGGSVGFLSVAILTILWRPRAGGAGSAGVM